MLWISKKKENTKIENYETFDTCKNICMVSLMSFTRRYEEEFSISKVEQYHHSQTVLEVLLKILI